MKDIRTLIIGGTGQLGTELLKLRPDWLAPTHAEFDIEVSETVDRYLYDLRQQNIFVETIVNCAVCKDEADLDQLYAVNINAVKNLLRFCWSCYRDLDVTIKLVHVSTDYVYGLGNRMNRETDPLKPESLYAVSKMFGEKAIIQAAMKPTDYLILRTSFFPRPFTWTGGHTNKYTSGDFVDVIAGQIVEAMGSGLTGIYNVGTSRKSVYDLLRQQKPDIEPVVYGNDGVYDTSMDTSRFESKRESIGEVSR